jgi:hypothetical protein
VPSAVALPWPAVAGFLAIPLYLGAAVLLGDVMAAGQTGGGLPAMVAAHFFEHTLDYAFVTLLCAGTFGLMLGRA